MDIDVKQPFLLHPGEGQPSTSNQVNLENVADFSSVCRTCAAITEYVVPIFSGEGLQHNLADKIHKHLPIQVSETDELPRSVCVQCVSTLLAWSELVQCCRDADQALRTRLGQMQGGSRQDLKPTNEGNQSGQTGSNECKPCQHSGDDHDAFCKQLITTTGYDDYLDDDASESSEDDEPLSSLATKKPTDHRALGQVEIQIDGAMIKREMQESAEGNEDRSFEVNIDRKMTKQEFKDKISRKKKFCCDCCGLSFDDRTSLRTHIRFHMGLKPHTCLNCYRSFSTKSRLKKHQQIDSRKFSCVRGINYNYVGGVLTCMECDETFTARIAYINHIRSHIRALGDAYIPTVNAYVPTAPGPAEQSTIQ